MLIKGPTDELLASLLEAETLLAMERMDLPGEIRVFGLMARVYLYRGEARRAQEAAEKAASAIAKTMPTNFWIVEGYAGAAEAFLALWQMPERQSQVVDLGSDIKNQKSRARQSCRALMGFARVFTNAQPRAWLWQGVYEWQAHRQSAAQSAWEKSVKAAEKLGMPYEERWAHYEIGRRLGDCTHLEQAIAIFAGIGAEWDLARAREALARVTK